MPTPSLYKRLHDSDSLTDVLIQMEDFLDSLDIYVFNNWIEGEVVDGPNIRRYWTSMTLKYEYKQMPDPRGAERLIKHGAKVRYTEDTEEKPREVKTPDDLDERRKPKVDSNKIWLVEIQIPRRFIEELDDSDLELHQDDVDVENVSDARDEDVDETDAFTQEGPEAEAEAEPADEEGAE